MTPTRTVCLFATAALAGCQAPTQSCNSFWDAMRSGAIAGLQEGVTGQQQENPCLAQGGPPQDAQVSQPSQDDLAARYGQKYAELIREGRIDYGMSEEEVLLAWGEPVSKRSQGKSKDIWNYGDDRVVFTKGTVSAVNH